MESGLDFGEDAIILYDEPFIYKNITFVGLPFEQIEGEKLIAKLNSKKKYLREEKTNILLFHGELLDSTFSRHNFGEEGELRYMPVKLSYFKDINISYILAGHFHTNFDVRKFSGGKYFIYPGSPVSVTRKEIGQRSANLLEVGKAPKQYMLNTHHYEEVQVVLDPFEEIDPIDIIKEKLEKVHSKATITLIVKGYIDGQKINKTEKELSSQIKALTAGKNIELYIEFKDIQKVLNSDIFKSFQKKLYEKDELKEEADELRNIALKALMEAGL